MSIKIDLMPRYVALQRRFRNFLMLAGALLAGTAAILGLIYLKGQNDLGVMKRQLKDAERVAGLTEKAQSAQTTATSAAVPLESFVQFVVNAGQTGAQRAALLDLVRRYISPDAVISQIDMSDGQNAKITATFKTPNDYARFLLNLRRGSATNGGALFAEDPKSFAVVPQNPLPGTGFSRFALPQRTTQPVVVTYPITMTVTGKLKDNIVVPSEPGTAAASTRVGGYPGGASSGYAGGSSASSRGGAPGGSSGSYPGGPSSSSSSSPPSSAPS